MLALPWYLHALGPKLWGLVGFVSTLQAVLAILDAGVGQALVREMAVRLGDAGNTKRRAAALLFGFERIYWSFALIVAAITGLSANIIATGWMKLGDLPSWYGQLAVYGAAALFFVQLPSTTYRSVLVGSESQLTLNVLNVIFVLLRHGGGVIVVLVHPTLMAYLIWQVTISFADTLFRAIAAWRIVGMKRSRIIWDPEEIRKSLAVAIPMSGAVLLGVLSVQMDKIILSRIVPIEQFGYYMIASSVGLGVLQLVAPINQAILPRLVALRNDSREQRKLNIKHAGLNVSIIAGATFIFALFGKTLLYVWLRKSEAAAAVFLPLVLLLCGSAMNALYNIGYLNWMARGKTVKIMQVNVASIVFAIILIPPLTELYGLPGGAIGWLGMNLIGFILSLESIISRRSNA